MLGRGLRSASTSVARLEPPLTFELDKRRLARKDVVVEVVAFAVVAACRLFGLTLIEFKLEMGVGGSEVRLADAADSKFMA